MKKILTILLMSLILISVVSASTMILQDADTENLKDSYVRRQNPDTNYGGTTQLWAQIKGGDAYSGRRSYLEFDISSLYLFSIFNITSSKLGVYCEQKTFNPDVSIYHVYDWNTDELQIT